MDMKFYKSCYNLAAFAACIQPNSENQLDTRIEFTDNFFAIAKYKFVYSDYLSPSKYEDHEFEISFIRDEKLVETFIFKKRIDRKNLGSLANPHLGLEEKLEAIKELRPSFSDKLEVLLKKTKLASYEVDMIIEKNKKMFEELTSNQTKQKQKK